MSNPQQPPMKPLGEMTSEERTNYSIQRAPDYSGKQEAVLTTSRTKCWSARDQLFECLDKNNDQINLCKDFYQVFSSVCLNSWADYFMKKRAADKNKKEFLERTQ
ncbi:hypothetical protein CYY_004726 [Polysphondylium violaceum]|uniref:Cytochrome c oxidase subunit VIb n=1 Tax=Polysphondylium violaceum TaxID=133409 RepID=A0A8J4UST1_9MYCE|nr:hypothetical protein CYY_004726 [Polysphondylium violaceum]